MRYPPDTGTDPLTRRMEREGAAEVERILLAKRKTSFEAVCANCGDQFMAPSWENPADTLCVGCAEEEQNS